MVGGAALRRYRFFFLCTCRNAVVSRETLLRFLDRKAEKDRLSAISATGVNPANYARREIQEWFCRLTEKDSLYDSYNIVKFNYDGFSIPN